jgi:hypothetical protein
VQFGVDYIARTRGTSTLRRPASSCRWLRELSVLYPDIRGLERLPAAVLDEELA